MRRAALVALVLVLMPLAALAQMSASLVADRVELTGDGRLIAEGNVMVFYEGTVLSAARITYDRATDRLAIDGPIFLRTAEGAILTADAANLDPQLRGGLLRSARLVLNEQLQLAANRLDRAEGRYSALSQAAVTSCAVCDDRPPLWEIRARQVIHDEEARQIYFDNATFRLGGVPVLWLPRLRLPDPTNTRATGFLIPEIRSTDQLGLGIKTPWFVTLGPHRDLTLTPYLSPRTTTLEARYRQALLSGEIAVRGAISQDEISAEGLRGFILAEGAFDLARDRRLTFGIERTSDPAYLLDYGQGDKDRLASFVALEQVRQRTLFQSDLTFYESLREGESNAALPPLVARLAWERQAPQPFGLVTYGAGVDALARTGTATGDAGRDVFRAGGFVAWRGDWIVGPGLLAEIEGRLALDAYRIDDDPAWPGSALTATPAVGATLRWPLVRAMPGGSVHVIEPAAHLGWGGRFRDSVPNEDSTIVEFDEGNLFALDRFPGEDAAETGMRASLGIGWTRIGPEGSVIGLSFGRLLRADGDPGFSEASGLAGPASDWLIAGRVDLPNGLAISGRTLLDDAGEFGKSAARTDWSGAAVDLSAAYVWLPAEDFENRPDPIAEWTVSAAYRIGDRWTLRANGRYDIAADRPARAGVGLGWRNECVTVDVSVSRRYTSTATVEPTTDFGLSVSLGGFSAGQSTDLARAACRN